jgi:hypothetical protein
MDEEPLIISYLMSLAAHKRTLDRAANKLQMIRAGRVRRSDWQSAWLIKAHQLIKYTRYVN